MYDKLELRMDVLQDLMMEDDNSTMPVPYSEASGMRQTPSSYARYAVLNDTFIASHSAPPYVPATAGPSAVQASSKTSSYYDDDSDGDDVDYDYEDDISVDSNSNKSGPVGSIQKSLQKQQRKVPQTKQKTSAKGGANAEQKERKLPGPRPSRTLEEMTPLEAERRRRRRERNKNAAAKCRQRRVEQTNTLQAQTEQLEQESSRLEREIDSLRRVKNQLEYVLDAHKPTCTAVFTNIKTENLEVTSSLISAAIRPNNLPISTVPTTCRNSLISSSGNFLEGMTSSASLLEGRIFSFTDTPTAFSGMTPMLMAGELGSPSSFVMLSPSTLIAQQ